MNIKMFILLGCFAAFCQNCKKESACDPDYFKSLVDLEPLTFLPDSFLCTATKEVPGLGTIPWTANGAVYIRDNTLQLRFGTLQDTITRGIREHLSISYVPIVPKHFVVGNFDAYAQPPIFNTFATYARTLDDGDVADAFWRVDESEENFIEITYLDLEAKRVDGRFDLFFLMKTQGSHGILYSEQIHFKSGSFTARIVE